MRLQKERAPNAITRALAAWWDSAETKSRRKHFLTSMKERKGGGIYRFATAERGDKVRAIGNGVCMIGNCAGELWEVSCWDRPWPFPFPALIRFTDLGKPDGRHPLRLTLFFYAFHIIPVVTDTRFICKHGIQSALILFCDNNQTYDT